MLSSPSCTGKLQSRYEARDDQLTKLVVVRLAEEAVAELPVTKQGMSWLLLDSSYSSTPGRQALGTIGVHSRRYKLT
jgi:hypothetical protein